MTEKIQGAQQVARRTLALFAVWGITAGAERDELHQWVTENNLETEVTPLERKFYGSTRPAKKDKTNFSWHSERLIMLLWALRQVAELPPADEQCDTSVFEDILPPFADITVDAFIRSAKLRPKTELIKMADSTEYLHWAARDGKLNNRAPKLPVDIEVIQERHHAINWIVGRDGQPWDEITTDT